MRMTQKRCKQVIPSDVLFDILLFLPAKSLVRFKTVCKVWYSYITSSYFIKKQLDGYHQKLVLSSSDSFQLVNYKGSQVEAMQLDFPLEDKDGLKDISSCNGLLCITLKDGKIVLWNPSTREFKQVQLPRDRGDFRYTFGGFGYDNSHDDYKIVALGHGRQILLGTTVEIFSLRNNSWKQMPNLPWYIMFLATPQPGILVRGDHQSRNRTLYWQVDYVQKYEPIIGRYSYHKDDHIKAFLCLDLMKEEFCTLTMPDDICSKASKFELGNFGGCLSIYKYSDEGYADIWVHELKEVKKWTELITIPPMKDLLPEMFAPICIMNNGEVLLNLKEENKLCLFNPEDKALRAFEIQTLLPFDRVIMHTETLVSPNAIIDGEDRRQMSY